MLPASAFTSTLEKNWMLTWALFPLYHKLVTGFDVNMARQSYQPGGNAPYGRMSVQVQLRHSREAAGSPSRSVAATWLHLRTQKFHHVTIVPKINNNERNCESVESPRSQTFTSREEGIKDDLRSVKEIPKLSLPDGKQLRLCDTHSIFKSENSLLRQRAVTHLNTQRHHNEPHERRMISSH